MRSIQLQSRIRKEIGAVVSPQFIRSLHQRSALRSLATLAHIWLAIALALWLAGLVLRLPLALAIPAGAILTLFLATRINALNVQVHEGSHGGLAENPRTNEWLTNALAAWWIGIDADGYRAVHSKHHQRLNEAEDPDRPLYELAPGRAALARGFLSDFLGISSLQRAWVYARQATERGGTARAGLPAWVHLAGKVLTNGALLGSQVWLYGLASGLFVYVVFWALPLLCLYPMIIRLRIVAEHFAPEIMATDPERIPFVARTSVCSGLEHYLFGAQMDYHFEHHLFPGIPYANLRRLHAVLQRERFFETSPSIVAAHSLSGGYFHFWRELLKSDYFAGAVGTPVAGTH